MEFYEVVQRRRMVRHYDRRPVPRAALERILHAAVRAPSAGHSQGQSFLVITNATTRANIAALAREEEHVAAGLSPWLSSAPVHVVVCARPDSYRERYSREDKSVDPATWPVPYWWVDAGASLQLLLLAVVDEGLAAGFLGIHSLPGLSELMGIPSDAKPIGLVTVGYPAPDPPSRSLQLGQRPDRIRWERWFD